MNAMKALCIVGLIGSVIGLANSARGAGADVQHTGLGGGIYSPTGLPVNVPVLGNIYAYALGSNTCNIGDAPLLWQDNGTPALSMNAFRLANGRLEQIGTGMAKTACCVGNSPTCGASVCSGPFGHLLAGCMDTYSGSWNAIIGNLAPRSLINPSTGAFSGIPAFGGNATIGRRLQVRQTDMEPATYPGALYFVEGQYICTEDAANGNWANNASYGRVIVGATFGYTLSGAFNIGRPAIYAWQDHGIGAGVPDLNVFIQNVDVPGDGRFIIAHKVTQIGRGQWHYEYAIQNFNSDRAGGSFRVPLPVGAVVSNLAFRGPWYHDEDAVYNVAGWPSAPNNWAAVNNGYEVRWSSPQTFAQNANAYALRWGTLYNYSFDCNRAPVAGLGELDLFKPASGCQPSTMSFGVSVPGSDCKADVVRNGAVDVNDLLVVINNWGACVCAVNCPANVNKVGGNTAVDVNDLLGVINTWGGCP